MATVWDWQLARPDLEDDLLHLRKTWEAGLRAGTESTKDDGLYALAGRSHDAACV